MSAPPLVYVTTLAEYQTEFWLPVARQAERAGCEVRFISFDDRSTLDIRSSGFKAYATDAAARRRPVDDARLARLCERFGIERVHHWIAHERYAFAIGDTGALLARLAAYLEMADAALADGAGRRPVLVQELGGFVSVVASYHAALARGVDNWFIEPSFFRGRMFFIRNSFAALDIRGEPGAVPSPEVREYLRSTLAARSIVIPKKDRHHYTSALRKIVNTRHVRRFAEKMIDKHVRGMHQEFGHIGHHVRSHARMLGNTLRLRGRVEALAGIGPFVYYPFHVPADVALTLRSPRYVDQIALIEFIARSIPPTHRLALKEHPAQIGAIDAERLAGLLDRFDNIVLLAPQTNNFTVLDAADAVVSVNSKSGAEAMLLGKPVIVLGDAFYRNSPFATRVDRLEGLADAIEAAIARPRTAPDEAAVERYFESVWRRTLPGELYVTAPTNVAAFTASMLRAIEPAEVAVA